MKIRIFANAAHIMSGGDKIYMEYAKRWKKAGHTIRITTNPVGELQCQEHGIDRSDIQCWSPSSFDRFGVFFTTLAKAASATWRALQDKESFNVFFSSSFTWPDVLPGVIAKFKHPRATWIVGWYVFLPSPFTREYHGSRFNLFVMNIVQWISYRFVLLWADGVFTASSADVPRFAKHKRLQNHVIAIRGGLDYEFFRAGDDPPSHEATDGQGKKFLYDAVFVGRFHPQKSVDELIDIWSVVTQTLPHARLALIGDGYMKDTLVKQVKQVGLEQNVVFLGPLDGEEKRTVLKQSALFVSASRYDSGNLALDEALASGVPGIICDLSHADYPEGVLFIKKGDHKAFASTVVDLLHNDTWRLTLRAAGIRAAAAWDWEKKANIALQFIEKLHTSSYNAQHDG